MTETHFSLLILLSPFQSPGVTWKDYQKTNRREKKASWLRLAALGKARSFLGFLFASHPLEKNWGHQQSADAMGMDRHTGVHCCYQKNTERGSRGNQYVLVISTGRTLQTRTQLQFDQNWGNKEPWLLPSPAGTIYPSAHWAKPQKTRLGERMYSCWTVTNSSTPCHEDHVGSLVPGGDQVPPFQHTLTFWEESGRWKVTTYSEEATSFLKRQHGQCHKPSLSMQCQQRYSRELRFPLT